MPACEFLQVLYLALPLLVLANRQIIEVWHHGEIFARHRAWLEALGDNVIADLLLCPFCLSHWTAFGLTICAFLVMSAPLTAERLCLCGPAFFLAIPYTFAVAGLSNLLNDACYKIWRTPGRKMFEDTLLLNRLAQQPIACKDLPGFPETGEIDGLESAGDKPQSPV